jgi:hypothetical protein
MHTENFQTKDKQTEICGIKDAESWWFVFWLMLLKKWPTPCRFVFQKPGTTYKPACFICGTGRKHENEWYRVQICEV